MTRTVAASIRTSTASARFQRLAGLGWLVMLLAAVAGLAAPDRAAGQAPSTDDSGLMPVQDMVLPTKDGVQLHCSYYASKRGKNAVPVICLHGFKGNRHDFKSLAASLQGQGHAVICPDLRGHGDSTTVEGFSRKLEAESMPAKHFEEMVRQDVEAVKKFLMERNNAGELNIEKLCVVGAEMGALVATKFAVLDWSWPPYGAQKQGQDVKALVLLSPEYRFKNLTISRDVSTPVVRDKLSLFITVGADDRTLLRDAENIYSSLERQRKDRMGTEDQDLFLSAVPTSLQGTRLLGEESLGVEQNIGKFIELMLVKKSMPWAERRLAP